MGSILLGKKEKYNFGLYDSIYSTVLNGWSNLTVSVNAKSRTMDGKVVLCFIRRAAVSSAASTVRPAGGVGVIVAQDPGDALGPGSDDFSCIAVNYELGTQKLLYICSSKSLSVKTSLSRTLVGNPVATRVVYFSSRGVSPAILKTDIAAIRASMPQPAVVTMDKYVTTCGGDRVDQLEE
ncbi:subtilisin-like protease SBT3.5 [Ricinus communis]|uniref:subtilisin-like protease SBT3.5 n=1 Tax=Ricinus communis TaxID=3988 RepID=UPI0007723E6F|nr:subtilisin-like protease SBT3.5 [Ricinus communis]|eukprot:XP_015574454.1 subtilisin-like protease SBT3.5 [Ricinus communis]